VVTYKRKNYGPPIPQTYQDSARHLAQFEQERSNTSIGGKGLTVNLKDGKTRTTVGLPGTGISYTETSLQHVPSNVTTPERQGISAWFWLLLIVVVGLVVVLVR
jgi:hypothetical protein